MTTWEKIVELLEQLVTISSENSNLQLDIIDKLEISRINGMNSAKNSFAIQNILERRLK